MKKRIAIMILIVAIFSLTVGCGKSSGSPSPSPTPPPAPPEPTLEDGTWVGHTTLDPEADRVEIGVAEITVEDGKITEVSYKELSGPLGAAKDDSYPYPPYFTAVDALNAQLLEVQDPEELDEIAGCTATVEKYKEAVAQAIENSEGNTFDYYDGTYVGVAEANDRGNYGVAVVTFYDDMIVHVVYNDVTPEGKIKDETYPFPAYFTAVEELVEMAISGDIDEIDVVVGCTSTSQFFIEAVENAAEAAAVQ